MRGWGRKSRSSGGADEDVGGDVSEEAKVEMGEDTWEDGVVKADEGGSAGVDEEE